MRDEIDELIALIDPILASRTLAEWAEALDREGCYWGTVQSVEEAVADPQTRDITQWELDEYLLDY